MKTIQKVSKVKKAIVPLKKGLKTIKKVKQYGTKTKTNKKKENN